MKLDHRVVLAALTLIAGLLAFAAPCHQPAHAQSREPLDGVLLDL